MQSYVMTSIQFRLLSLRCIDPDVLLPVLSYCYLQLVAIQELTIYYTGQ